MLKRAGILLLAMALALTMALPAAAGAENFKKVNTYEEGTLYGVSPENWFYDNAKTAYELGLMKGTGGDFRAWSDITLAETITIAARMHSIYKTGKGDFVQGSPWYRVYVDYALKEGILLFEYDDYNKAATRAEFAYILSRALPGEALPAINTVEDGGIPDVYTGAEYYDAVYMLYRAGVLTGNDAGGAFAPKSKIQRAAVAAIITRMADPSLRRSITLKKPAELSASEIYAKCAPAVFYIETFDVEGKPYATGSGFFIDESGIAVTNYHLFDNAVSARVTLYDGRVLDVEGMIWVDYRYDGIYIIVEGEGYDYIPIGDSEAASSGDRVYAMGSLEGEKATVVSSSVVSPVNDKNLKKIKISETTAEYMNGGPLIDRYGRAIALLIPFKEPKINLTAPIYLTLPEGGIYESVDEGYGTMEEFTQVIAYYQASEEPFLITDIEDYIQEAEPNDTEDEASFIKNAIIIKGSIKKGDKDIFLVRCNAPGRIELRLSCDYPDMERVEYITAQIRPIRDADDPGAYMELNPKVPARYLSYTIPYPGTYIIEVKREEPYKDQDIEIAYDLTYRYYPVFLNKP